MIKRLISIFIFCLIFTGCGEKDIIDQAIETGNTTKFNLAKNYVISYGKTIDNAYVNYKYNKALGNDYVVSDGILVDVDGAEVILNVSGFNDINCSSIVITNGRVKLDNCYIYGFNFMYENGKAIEK